MYYRSTPWGGSRRFVRTPPPADPMRFNDNNNDNNIMFVVFMFIYVILLFVLITILITIIITAITIVVAAYSYFKHIKYML